MLFMILCSLLAGFTYFLGFVIGRKVGFEEGYKVGKHSMYLDTMGLLKEKRRVK